MNIFKIFKRKPKKPKQYTFCYCPNCKNELIGSDSFDKEDDRYVYYTCSKCGNKSKWDFISFPVPVLIKKK